MQSSKGRDGKPGSRLAKPKDYKRSHAKMQKGRRGRKWRGRNGRD